MADLFDGLPDNWIHSDDSNAGSSLTNDVFDWISKKASDTYQKWGDTLYGAGVKMRDQPMDHTASRFYDPQTGIERLHGFLSQLDRAGQEAAHPELSMRMVNGVPFYSQGFVGGTHPGLQGLTEKPVPIAPGSVLGLSDVPE